jgi:hypothetical protein
MSTHMGRPWQILPKYLQSAADRQMPLESRKGQVTLERLTSANGPGGNDVHARLVFHRLSIAESISQCANDRLW